MPELKRWSELLSSIVIGIVTDDSSLLVGNHLVRFVTGLMDVSLPVIAGYCK